MLRSIQNFLYREQATTSVEYAVMLALIISVALASIASVGTALSDNVFDSSSKLGTAMSS
jgi:Flp pilus assembly pilin Flp